jgi:hypothetical protein|tara:strand:- start:1879 stop:2388 length:510 start_codon:yes stop_codon:yes gene_type:complete
MEEEEENTSLKGEIRRMNENFETLVEKNQAKRFKMPWSGRVGKGKVKRNYASICYIGDNREARFMKLPIQEGTVMINGAPHLATTDFMLSYKGKPFLIVPSWNIKPFSPEENYDEATKLKTTTAGYRLLLNTMKLEQIKVKKGIGLAGGVIFAIIILGIIAYYFFNGGA